MRLNVTHFLYLARTVTIPSPAHPPYPLIARTPKHAIFLLHLILVLPFTPSCSCLKPSYQVRSTQSQSHSVHYTNMYCIHIKFLSHQSTPSFLSPLSPTRHPRNQSHASHHQSPHLLSPSLPLTPWYSITAHQHQNPFFSPYTYHTPPSNPLSTPVTRQPCTCIHNIATRKRTHVSCNSHVQHILHAHAMVTWWCDLSCTYNRRSDRRERFASDRELETWM
jgi:hypothetical protein